jgi:alkylation response protein AidB-like acyl-CoA dehydrogenase
MDFTLSQDQKLLVETASSFAKKSSPVTRFRKLRDDARGFDPKVWAQMGELGWLGVAFPEAAGGFGGRFIDLALIVEQLGVTLVPEPLIPSLVLGGMAIAAAGDAAQHERWLAPLIAGTATVALAHAERGGRFAPTAIATRAERKGAGYVLAGEKVWVLGGHAADVVVVAARTAGEERDASGISLFALDANQPGMTITPLKTMDGQHAATIVLDGAEVAADRLLGKEGAGGAILEDVLDRAAAAACAEAVGIAATVLAMTVDYLKTREQFGVKIGVFQALQHRAVEMFVETELLRGHALEAALRIDEGSADERRAAVSAAKVALSTSGRFVVKQAIQLHGGIGITDEHDVGLYFKRLQVLSTLFGDEEHHLERFAGLPGFYES